MGNEDTHSDGAVPPDQRRSSQDDDGRLVPARMINEVLYCERLMYLEWCQNEFQDNVFTVDGRMVHRRADEPGGNLPDPSADAKADPEVPYRARAVWFSSEELGITGKIDVVEGENGVVTPIEYKRGHAPDVPEGAHLPERAQVCAYVLLLRAQGYRCDQGEIYFAADRRRVPIAIDEALIATTLAAVERARALASQATVPPVLKNSPKCDGCSLAGICLPDELNLLLGPAADLTRDLGVAGADDGAATPELEPMAPTAALPSGSVRRLYALRDDRIPVYVQSHRARISVNGERLLIRNDEVESEARLPNTSQVAVFGNVQVTTPALHALLDRDIALSFFSYGGWFLGRMVGTASKNVELKIAQFRRTEDAEFSLRLARRLVTSKILNCRTMLRRNHDSLDPVALRELRIMAGKALRAAEIPSLLGIEGTAARIYFQSFQGMLKVDDDGPGFHLESRNRRPPRDPINAMLSFCYGLLSKDLTLALTAAGLDPLLGFYHRPRHGRPALALDLMEEFRPLIADSVVINAVNTGVVGTDDFIRTRGSCALKPAARKRLIGAYERRMDQLITHPIFEYRLSYRRVLELQARLLTRVLLGEIEDYPMFRTR